VVDAQEAASREGEIHRRWIFGQLHGNHIESSATVKNFHEANNQQRNQRLNDGVCYGLVALMASGSGSVGQVDNG
jgi:hypothetical protein